MKMNSKSPKEEGIISIVQSPKGSEKKRAKEKKISKKNDSEKDKGIISVVQTPEDDEDKIIIGN